MNTKERSIIFSTEMVKALLAGRKSQTRRLVKGSDGCPWDYPLDAISPWMVEKCKYGKVGDKLWVREKIYCFEGNKLPELKPVDFRNLRDYGCYYAANIEDSELDLVTKTISPIFMPRWCCRIKLVLAEVSIERVGDISKADAISEGLEILKINGRDCYVGGSQKVYVVPQLAFRSLWNSLNTKPGTSFTNNPWVWVLKFDVCPIRS